MTNQYGLLQCDFCGAQSENSVSAHKAGWDWFTGYRKETLHACARCRRVRASEFHAAFDASRIPKPLEETRPVRSA